MFEFSRFKDKSKSPKNQVTGDKNVSTTIHVQVHKAYQDMTEEDFIYIDETIAKEVDKVIRNWNFDDSKIQGNAGGALKIALKSNVSWEEIERAFTVNRFWERESAPTMTASDFDALKGVGALRRLTAFAQHKEKVIAEQLESSKKHIPAAKSWFVKFMKDADINDHLELDPTDVWKELTSINVGVKGPNGKMIPVGRDHAGMHEKTFLDIGILRFPDYTNPRVKVFRLRMTVWSQCFAEKTVPSISSGIRADLTSCVFRPRKEYRDKLVEAAAKLVA